jgi:hypothetical protein
MSKQVYTITVERETDASFETQNCVEVSGLTISRLLSDVRRRYPEADGWTEWSVAPARTFASDLEAAEWCAGSNYLEALVPAQAPNGEWCAKVVRTGEILKG